jgi:DNA-binding transcriptional regulator YdaS (Cro superfamily)
MDIKIEIEPLTMDTVVGEHLRQVGEDDRAGRPVTLGDAVVDQVVQTKISDETERDLNRRVSAIRDEVIREELRPAIIEALGGEIKMTNTYGEPTGRTTTLRELIIAQVGKTMNEKDRYSSGKTFVNRLVGEEVERVVKRELNEAMAAEKARAVAAIRAKAADVLAQVITEGLGGR